MFILQLTKQDGRGKSAGEPGPHAEQAQQFDAKGLAGFSLAGADMQIGRNSGVQETVRVKNPEGKNGELIFSTYQVLAEEGGDQREHLLAVHELDRGFGGHNSAILGIVLR